jgi:hypothetical protein
MYITHIEHYYKSCLLFQLVYMEVNIIEKNNFVQFYLSGVSVVCCWKAILWHIYHVN